MAAVSLTKWGPLAPNSALPSPLPANRGQGTPLPGSFRRQPLHPAHLPLKRSWPPAGPGHDTPTGSASMELPRLQDGRFEPHRDFRDGSNRNP